MVFCLSVLPGPVPLWVIFSPSHWMHHLRPIMPHVKADWVDLVTSVTASWDSIHFLLFIFKHLSSLTRATFHCNTAFP
jgi:hypothetical protein